jgi:hypothetical protein
MHVPQEFYHVSLSSTTTKWYFQETLISSKIAREQIIYALRNYPDIDNSNELQKLDQFISYLYRYSRKKIEIERLYEYLKKVRGIETEQCIKICERVNIGLHVLDVYNRKYNK